MSKPVVTPISGRSNGTGELAKPLPQNQDAERSILAAILLDDDALPAAVEKGLTSDDFALDFHRRIFNQMIELGEAQRAIDIVTLSDELHRKGELEAAGGVGYIAQLVDGVPRVTHLEHYVRMVKEKALLRRLIHTTHAIQQTAIDQEDDADAILDRAENAVAQLRSARTKNTGLTAYTAPQLGALSPEPIEYVAYPAGARGMVAIVDGLPKASGKTTFLLCAVLASSRGKLFLNHPTKCIRVLYVTEENPRTINMAVARAELSEYEELFIVPFTSFAGMPWLQLVRQIERLCVELQIGWLIIDTFYAVAGLGGEEENKAGAVDLAIAPLRAIAGRLDIAVTITRHERKSGGEVGTSGRGSSALTGAVDIVLLLKRIPGNQIISGQRRQLDLTGRVEQATLTIELRADGSYVVVDVSAEQSTTEEENLVRAISANPSASIRQLERETGVCRNRLEDVARRAGWIRGESGWEESNSCA